MESGTGTPTTTICTVVSIDHTDLHYTVCSSCQRTLPQPNPTTPSSTLCNHCTFPTNTSAVTHPDSTPKRLFRVLMSVATDTNVFVVVLFDRAARVLFGCSAQDFFNFTKTHPFSGETAGKILEGEMLRVTLSRPKNGNAQHHRVVSVVPLRSGFRPVMETLTELTPPKLKPNMANALFSKIVKDMEVHFDLTGRQKAIFECLRAPHAQLAVPIAGLGQHMSPVEYRAILKYRLMISLFPVDEMCPVCRKACLDSFGEHAVHCRELPGFKYRHDFVRDVLFDIFRRAGISVKKEAPVNFLTDPLDGRSTLRPADILVFGWVRGKHACVDLTGVSPLVGLGSGEFVTGRAALKAASCKVTKHEKHALKTNTCFFHSRLIPLVSCA